MSEVARDMTAYLIGIVVGLLASIPLHILWVLFHA